VEENRKKYPSVAKLIDEVRIHFPKAKVLSIKPNQSPTTPEADDLVVVEYD